VKPLFNLRCLWIGKFLLFVLCASYSALAQQPTAGNTQTNLAALKAEMNQAMDKVRAIVNQPVQAYRRARGMRVAEYPYWFHEGAARPHFNTVDVRTTQELIYDKDDYVTSDLNPGIVFIGRQLEFNSMTKYFYTNRSLPKKKLSQAEMLEINRLYRIIGRCEKEIVALENPEPTKEEGTAEVETTESETQLVREPVPKANYIKTGIGVAAVLVVYGVYRILRRSFSS
jgi:hypothetical protein